VDPKNVAAVGRWLRTAIGVPFVIVGGSAIERIVPVGTKDVDVLVESADMPAVDSAIATRKEATPLEPRTGRFRGTIVRIGGASVDLEFLTGDPFSGDSDPESFIEYVRSTGSVVEGGIRYAKPGVVFYMRLNPPDDDWRAYAPSIERDIESGVTPRTLDEAARIADRFGVGPEVRGRIESIRTRLGLADNVPGE
jgi:hypothetical protein